MLYPYLIHNINLVMISDMNVLYIEAEKYNIAIATKYFFCHVVGFDGFLFFRMVYCVDDGEEKGHKQSLRAGR